MTMEKVSNQIGPQIFIIGTVSPHLKKYLIQLCEGDYEYE